MDKINKTKLLLITFLTGLSKCAEEGVVRPDEQITSAVQVEQAGPSQMASTNLVFILASGKKGDIPHTFLGKEVSGDDLRILGSKARRAFEVHPTSEVKLVLGAEIMSPGMPIEKLSEVIQVVLTDFTITPIPSEYSPFKYTGGPRRGFQIPDTSLPDKPTLQEVAKWMTEMTQYCFNKGWLDFSGLAQGGDRFGNSFDTMELVRIEREYDNSILFRVKLYSEGKDIEEKNLVTYLIVSKIDSKAYLAQLLKRKKKVNDFYLVSKPLMEIILIDETVMFGFGNVLRYNHCYDSKFRIAQAPTKISPESGTLKADGETEEGPIVVDLTVNNELRERYLIEGEISRKVGYPVDLLVNGGGSWYDLLPLLSKTLTFRRRIPLGGVEASCPEAS